MKLWHPHWVVVYFTAVLAVVEDVCLHHNTCKGCISLPGCIWCPYRQTCQLGSHNGSREGPLLDCGRNSRPCRGCVEQGGDTCGFCHEVCNSAVEKIDSESCIQWLHGVRSVAPPELCYDFYAAGLGSLYMSTALPLVRDLSHTRPHGGNMTDEFPIELELSGLALTLILLLPVVIPVTIILAVYLALKLYRRYHRQNDAPDHVRRAPKLVPRAEARRLIDRLTTTQTVSADEDSTKTCNVCIDSIEAGVTRRTLWCGHVFHNDCIRTWLLRPQRIRSRFTDGAELQTRLYDPANMSCPTCRMSVVDALGGRGAPPTMIGQPLP